MSNIEIIQDFIEEMRSFELSKDTVEIVNALEDILAELEQDKKRIKELEQENKTLKNFTSAIFNGNIEKEFIRVQKVKDKIEDLRYNSNLGFEETLEEFFKIEALEEILEEK